ncbi:MAG: hypothetical protein CSA22_04770 [Deltaproteobacteria bacterium]|nr:MAG: hypothetical protein CSA22_04770 [Deltaproteobacteria bacterium]
MNDFSEQSKADIIIAKQHEKRLQVLHDARVQIQNMDAGDVVDAILAFSQPRALVHSFPASELHLLLHDIGLADCLPLLSLAANRQWEYLLDYEVWIRDRWASLIYIEWLERFLEADPQRLIDWLLDSPQDELVLFLSRHVHVRVREHDEPLSTIDSDYISFDDILYFKILTPDMNTVDNDDDSIPGAPWADTVVSLLKLLAEADHVRYQQLLFESTGLLDAEIEEEAYRKRCVRLSEKGFMAPEEAVGIYQPIPLSRLTDVVLGKNWSRDTADTAGISRLAARLLEETQDGGAALIAQLPVALKETFAPEFAALCNQLISADGFQVKGKDAVAAVVSRAASMIRLGIEVLLEASGNTDFSERSVQAMLAAVSLKDLFRAGNSRVYALKKDAEVWVNQSWFRKNKLPLRFWGEQGMGVLGGLLLDRPQWFDTDATVDSFYRAFASVSDANAAKRCLETLIALDTVLSCIVTRTDWIQKRDISAMEVFFTLWALKKIGKEGDQRALYSREATTAFDYFWQGAGVPRSVSPVLVDEVREWLHCKQAFSGDEERQTAFLSWLADAVGQIENEYGTVKTSDVDARFLRMFSVFSEI